MNYQIKNLVATKVSQELADKLKNYTLGGGVLRF